MSLMKMWMFLIQNCPQRKIADLNSGKILYCFVQSRKTFTVKGNKLIQTHRHTHTHIHARTRSHKYIHIPRLAFMSPEERSHSSFYEGFFVHSLLKSWQWEDMINQKRKVWLNKTPNVKARIFCERSCQVLSRSNTTTPLVGV